MIFNLGEEPQEPKMYIVINGTLEYTDAYGEITVVGERKIIAEARRTLGTAMNRLLVMILGAFDVGSVEEVEI